MKACAFSTDLDPTATTACARSVTSRVAGSKTKSLTKWPDMLPVAMIPQRSTNVDEPLLPMIVQGNQRATSGLQRIFKSYMHKGTFRLITSSSTVQAITSPGQRFGPPPEFSDRYMLPHTNHRLGFGMAYIGLSEITAYMHWKQEIVIQAVMV